MKIMRKKVMRTFCCSPSTSATILELMYDGELIWIDWSAYGSAGLN